MNIAKKILNALWAFFSALGVLAMAIFIGLYQSGFFHWAAQKFPGNAPLQFFFGG